MDAFITRKRLQPSGASSSASKTPRVAKFDFDDRMDILELLGKDGVDVECVYCKWKMRGKCIRVRAHLRNVPGKGAAPCPNVPTDVINKFAATFGIVVAAGAVAMRQASMYECSTTSAANAADMALARFFHAYAVPVNVTHSLERLPAIEALAKVGKGYVSPDRWKLSHSLLDSVHADVQARMQPIIESGNKQECRSAVTVGAT